METIRVQRRRIPGGLLPAPAASFAAARGSAIRRFAALPFVTTSSLAFATAFSVSAWPGPLSFYPFYLLTFFGKKSPDRGQSEANKKQITRGGCAAAHPPSLFSPVRRQGRAAVAPAAGGAAQLTAPALGGAAGGAHDRMRAAHPPPPPQQRFSYIYEANSPGRRIYPRIYISEQKPIYTKPFPIYPKTLSYIYKNASVYIAKQPSYIYEKGRKSSNIPEYPRISPNIPEHPRQPCCRP